jgi:hypothetical protein
MVPGAPWHAYAWLNHHEFPLIFNAFDALECGMKCSADGRITQLEKAHENHRRSPCRVVRARRSRRCFCAQSPHSA